MSDDDSSNGNYFDTLLVVAFSASIVDNERDRFWKKKFARPKYDRKRMILAGVRFCFFVVDLALEYRLFKRLFFGLCPTLLTYVRDIRICVILGF